MTTAGIPAAAVLHKTQMGALLPEDALLIQTAIKEINTDGLHVKNPSTFSTASSICSRSMSSKIK